MYQPNDGHKPDGGPVRVPPSETHACRVRRAWLTLLRGYEAWRTARVST